MRPWTGLELCQMAMKLFGRHPELLSLDPDVPVATLLEAINAACRDEPSLMLINARVEGDLGLLETRVIEGALPPEGDDDFVLKAQLLIGRFGGNIVLAPFTPNE